MTSRTIPRARYFEDNSVECLFPYHPRLIASFKTEIPSYARSYDPEDKVWSFVPAYAAIAVKLLCRYFPDARIEYGRGPEPEPIRSTDQHYAVLHLLPSAPPALVQAAYRTLAKLHHPDRGGSHEAMRRLNEALDRIEVAS